MLQTIEAIIFDMGGTLRHRDGDEQHRRHALEQVIKLLGCPDLSFADELQKRFLAYAEWAQDRLIELPESDIWTQWMLPDYPAEKIAPLVDKLGFWWRERNGRVVVKHNALGTLAELKKRGYRIGMVSNTTSTTDVPCTLERFGLDKYFETIVLSSTCGRRKPDPEIFLLATRAMNIAPSSCAYLGDRISRDVIGSRKAGFALALIIEPLGKPRQDERDQIAKPDRVIHELSELLDIFRPRNNS